MSRVRVVVDVEQCLILLRDGGGGELDVDFAEARVLVDDLTAAIVQHDLPSSRAVVERVMELRSSGPVYESQHTAR